MNDIAREHIEEPLHMRRTGSFVIDKVSTFTRLHNPGARFDERFLGVLGGLLPSSELRPFRNKGEVYSKLFNHLRKLGVG